MHFDSEGRLRAINPENGFFGVAPGTNYATNPNACYNISIHIYNILKKTFIINVYPFPTQAMLTIQKNTVFTNVAK